MEDGEPLASGVYGPSWPLHPEEIPGAARTLRTLGNFDYVIYSLPTLDESIRMLLVKEPVRVRLDALPEALEARGDFRSSAGPAACDLPRIRVTMSAKNWGPYDYEIALRPFQATTLEDLEDGAMDLLDEICSRERAGLPPFDRIKRPRQLTASCAAAFLPAGDRSFTLTRQPDGRMVTISQGSTFGLRVSELDCR